MKTILRVALRNVFRQKKRTVLLAGAIAFGMLMITLAQGFSAGMVMSIRSNFSHALGGHVFVSGQELTPSGSVVYRIGDEEVLSEVLSAHQDDIESVTRRSQTFGTLIFGPNQAMQMVYGVNFAEEESLFDGLTVLRGSADAVFQQERGLILPVPIGERLGVDVGEAVLIRMDTVTGQQNVGEFVVVALIEDQAQFGMSAAYANIEYLNQLLALPHGSYQSLNIFARDMAQISQLAASMRVGFGGEAEPVPAQDERRHFMGPFSQAEAEEPWEGTKLSVTTLDQIMEPVEALVQVLDTVGLGIFLIILVITMVGLMNTFRMILIERTKEIGTMRAFGMQQGTVKLIFLLEALFLGLLGAIVGLALASGLMAVISRLAWSEPALQFFLDGGRFAFVIELPRMLGNLGLLLGMSLAGAYWPARSAAKLSPIEALGSSF